MKKLENYSKVDPFKLSENPFDMLEKEWMLITAGIPEKFNTMTAAWGSFGILWKKPVAFIFIRPQRYTYQFAEENSFFTLSFFGHGNYREALNFCGTKSGRDFDKPKETDLTPVITPRGGIAFKQARLIFDCQKLYADDIKSESFIARDVEQIVYQSKDYHRFYIGEILDCYRL